MTHAKPKPWESDGVRVEVGVSTYVSAVLNSACLNNVYNFKGLILKWLWVTGDIAQ